MSEDAWFRLGGPECRHVPLPDTIRVEGQHDCVEVTLETSLDPKSWPRIALCKLCGRGIRLRGLIFDWTLAEEQPHRMSEEREG